MFVHPVVVAGDSYNIEYEALDTPQQTFNFEVEDFHTYYVSDLLILVHNVCTPNNVKNYSADEIAKRYDISTGEYHQTVKKSILDKVKPNHSVGKNPNILLNKNGEIAYQGAKGLGFQDTGLNIIQILIELGLR